jgi:hypothetical protein
MKTNIIKTFELDVIAWHAALSAKHIVQETFELTKRAYDIIVDELRPDLKVVQVIISGLPCVVIRQTDLH